MGLSGPLIGYSAFAVEDVRSEPCGGYSIASSPLMHPNKIRLCVVLVDWTVESTEELRLVGPSCFAVCSNLQWKSVIVYDCV